MGAGVEISNRRWMNADVMGAEDNKFTPKWNVNRSLLYEASLKVLLKASKQCLMCHIGSSFHIMSYVLAIHQNLVGWKPWMCSSSKYKQSNNLAWGNSQNNISFRYLRCTFHFACTEIFYFCEPHGPWNIREDIIWNNSELVSLLGILAYIILSKSSRCIRTCVLHI